MCCARCVVVILGYRRGWYTCVSQTGEGDHTVVRLGDYLLMFFLEWDGPRGALTVGAARAPVASAGVPGAWLKLLDGAWTSLGVGGDASAVVGLPGTSVYAVPDLGPSALVSTGVVFTGGPMGVAWSDDGEGREWAAAVAGPLFTAPPGSWDRTPASAELFAYAAMSGPRGAAAIPLDGTGFVYATYLAAGTDFSSRWLMRRPVSFFRGASTGVRGASPPPAALAALSIWEAHAPGGGVLAWATSGVVVPASGFLLVAPGVALLPTAPVVPIALLECALPGGGAALAVAGECGAPGSPFAGGLVNRTSGWLAQTLAGADALGWANVTGVGADADPGAFWSAAPASLWRCKRDGAFSAALGSGGCAARGAGWLQDTLLGFALSPLSQLNRGE